MKKLLFSLIFAGFALTAAGGAPSCDGVSTVEVEEMWEGMGVLHYYCDGKYQGGIFYYTEDCACL